MVTDRRPKPAERNSLPTDYHATSGFVPSEKFEQAAELTFEFGHDMMKRLMDEVQKELKTLPHFCVVDNVDC
jgi:hypothetical protein